MQGKDKTTEERRIAICIFDDIVEHCREAALRLVLIWEFIFLTCKSNFLFMFWCVNHSSLLMKIL